LAEKYITRPYEILKNNDIISKLNNQGRRPEQVLFSWLRGFALVAMAVFYKIVKLVKNGVLMIIHIYAKVSMNTNSFDAIILRNSFSLSYFVFFNIIDKYE
jgi:hypothetical protein